MSVATIRPLSTTEKLRYVWYTGSNLWHRWYGAFTVDGECFGLSDNRYLLEVGLEQVGCTINYHVTKC